MYVFFAIYVFIESNLDKYNCLISFQIIMNYGDTIKAGYIL